MAIGVGVASVVLVLGLAVGLAGAGVAAHISAANAADAAALAAAPVTFRPFGARGSPADEAARFAARNGARLISCRCPVDRSWDARTVAVEVTKTLRLPVVGSLEIRAESRATFEPVLLLGGG